MGLIGQPSFCRGFIMPSTIVSVVREFCVRSQRSCHSRAGAEHHAMDPQSQQADEAGVVFRSLWEACFSTTSVCKQFQGLEV